MNPPTPTPTRTAQTRAMTTTATRSSSSRARRPAVFLPLLLLALSLLPSPTHAFSARMHQLLMSATNKKGPTPPRLRQQPQKPPPVVAKRRPPVPGSSKDATNQKDTIQSQIYAKSLLPPKVKPTTLILEDKKQGLWVFEQPFVLGVVDVKNRMSVLRLADGGFAVFSPLAATEECIAMLRALVKKEGLKLSSSWFLAPSSFPEHHESLDTWRDIFPEARVVSVHPGVNVIAEYLLEGPPDEASTHLPTPLRQDLEVAVLETPLLREMIVCHKPSKTLFVADSGFYINEAYTNGLTKLVTQLQGIYDRFVTPPFFRLGVNKKQGRWLYEAVGGWEFDKIVTCHAALVETEGKKAFVEGYKHLA